VVGCVQPLICPVCGASLAKANNTLKCPQSHSFDISREGYVNLLLTGQKKPKILGDTKDMVRARRNFITTWLVVQKPTMTPFLSASPRLAAVRVTLSAG